MPFLAYSQDFAIPCLKGTGYEMKKLAKTLEMFLFKSMEDGRTEARTRAFSLYELSRESG